MMSAASTASTSVSEAFPSTDYTSKSAVVPYIAYMPVSKNASLVVSTASTSTHSNLLASASTAYRQTISHALIPSLSVILTSSSKNALSTGPTFVSTIPPTNRLNSISNEDFYSDATSASSATPYNLSRTASREAASTARSTVTAVVSSTDRMSPSPASSSVSLKAIMMKDFSTASTLARSTTTTSTSTENRYNTDLSTFLEAFFAAFTLVSKNKAYNSFHSTSTKTPYTLSDSTENLSNLTSGLPATSFINSSSRSIDVASSAFSSNARTTHINVPYSAKLKNFPVTFKPDLVRDASVFPISAPEGTLPIGSTLTTARDIFTTPLLNASTLSSKVSSSGSTPASMNFSSTILTPVAAKAQTISMKPMSKKTPLFPNSSVSTEVTSAAPTFALTAAYYSGSYSTSTHAPTTTTNFSEITTSVASISVSRERYSNATTSLKSNFSLKKVPSTETISPSLDATLVVLTSSLEEFRTSSTPDAKDSSISSIFASSATFSSTPPFNSTPITSCTCPSASEDSRSINHTSAPYMSPSPSITPLNKPLITASNSTSQSTLSTLSSGSMVDLSFPSNANPATATTATPFSTHC
ncbi:hypothetical protein KIN20_033702 [Parelaphostrongylus tenuis]|uniref:Uncharacterized protein n=1 Tax=Parelaphostrongylus tenuis TaxID=148309 RepID=A0AAD5R940_PARTN|nr:hypothetical protein KIN20_033702 [Parelaphostrongylus tenuis]